MEEQEPTQFTLPDDIAPKLLDGTEETENPQSNPEIQLNVQSEVYAEPDTENEVITVVSEEANEVFIYDRSDMEHTAETIQVCDSGTVLEEMNNSEEKDVNVDEIEEENVTEAVRQELKVKMGQDTLNLQNGNEDESSFKNFKNVILEDWEVEVPHANANRESEKYTEALVLEVGSEGADNESFSQIKAAESVNPMGTVDEISSNKSAQILANEKTEEGNVTENHESVEAHGEHESILIPIQNDSSLKETETVKEVTSHISEKRLGSLKCPKSVTKEEIVKILDDSSEKVIRPIVGGKDLFFSIELTKRLNQKLSISKNKTCKTGEKHNENDSCNNNNSVDDCQKIAEILQADEIKDWKSVPSISNSGLKENGNDMNISNAVKRMQVIDSKIIRGAKTPRKTPLKKLRTMDKELERTLALQQLREEFPSTRKRSRISKKINHVPFLASTVLEKAMTSPEVTTALKPGLPRRRPCYLPENTKYAKSTTESDKELETVNAEVTKVSSDVIEPDFIPGKSIATPVVKTYSVKRKSTDAENEIKTTLEVVAKALNKTSEEAAPEPKPKKQKTVTKLTKNKVLMKKKQKQKLKLGAKADKKMKSELEKLLGDEGAVRMLYDTQHGDACATSPRKTKFKTTTGIKKDLVLKTKLVKNAVMRLSGVGADGILLRGKRRSMLGKPGVKATETKEEEPLFSSTPNIVLYKPKKKQRAEASRILYRHSSSESFDSSEGYRRTSFDADELDVETKTNEAGESKGVAAVGTQRTPSKGRSKREVAPGKNKKKAEEKRTKDWSSERLSTDSAVACGSKLNLSNVPVRKSSRPRVVSRKYSVWSSTSMDCLSVESLGFKKLKKASMELGKKLNCKELIVMQYEHLVQVVLSPTTTTMKNSFTFEVLQELVHVFNVLSKEDSCRVVLFSSRGSIFCQGLDISRIVAFNESEKKKEVSLLVKAVRDFVGCLVNFKKPLIAGVQGAAVGLGVTLLPYCDLIISSDTASFYTPYVKLGQAPEGAPFYTFPQINRLLVSELLFKSHRMAATDALKLGLITQVIPEEKFDEDLLVISRNMAAQPVQGMQSVKSLLRKTGQWQVEGPLEAEGELLEEHWNSPECINNMIKFLNSGELQLKQNG